MTTIQASLNSGSVPEAPIYHVRVGTFGAADVFLNSALAAFLPIYKHICWRYSHAMTTTQASYAICLYHDIAYYGILYKKRYVFFCSCFSCYTLCRVPKMLAFNHDSRLILVDFMPLCLAARCFPPVRRPTFHPEAGAGNLSPSVTDAFQNQLYCQITRFPAQLRTCRFTRTLPRPCCH